MVVGCVPMSSPDIDMEAIGALARRGRFRLVTAFRYAPDPSAKPHAHEGFEIVHHLTSRVTVEIAGGQSVVCEPGTTRICKPAVMHAQHVVTSGENWCVLIECAGGARALRGLPPLVRIDSRLPDLLLADLVELVQPRQGDDVAERTALDLRASALLLSLLRLADRQASSAKRPSAAAHADQAAAIVMQEYMTVGSVDELAARMGISPHYLRHAVAARFGIGPARLLSRTRIEAAQRILRHTTKPLAAVAADCGFANARYLCTVFRRATGMSPGEYRNAHTHFNFSKTVSRRPVAD